MAVYKRTQEALEELQGPTLFQLEQKVNKTVLDYDPKYKTNIHESMLT